MPVTKAHNGEETTRNLPTNVKKGRGKAKPRMTKKEAEELCAEIALHPYFPNARMNFHRIPGFGNPGYWEVMADSQFCVWTFLNWEEWEMAKKSMEETLGVPGTRAQRIRY